MPSLQTPSELRREIGLGGAMMMGLGSIVGTGVFVSIGIAADVAGPGVLVAIVLAAVVATCNGLSSAQLAARHPQSGGTYEYGYRWLSPAAGFTAGWMFLCAKSASAATAALGFAGYLLHALGQGDRGLIVPVALATVAVVTVLSLVGIRRTSAANVAIVSVTLLSLVLFVLMGIPTAAARASENVSISLATFDGFGLLQATALMFVAYTGYGRIATLGEEVREPAVTIPRAVVATLAVSMVLYVAVAMVAVASVGAEAYGQTTRQGVAPLEVIAGGFDIPGVPLALAIGATTAMLGVLLNLILGLSRVLLAMGRRGDMPRGVARVRPGGTPHVATLVVAALIAALAAAGNVRLAWSFSAFTVLVYYALTNWCAIRLRPDERIFPIWPAWCGMAACGFLAFWVDWQVWLAGLGLVAVGLLWHAAARRRGVPTPDDRPR